MKFLCLVFALCLSVITSSAIAQTVNDGWEAYDSGDYETAKSIFSSLAKEGNAKAMATLGFLHSEGKIFPKDRRLACDWYEKAAKNGSPEGMSNLARCYYLGSGRAKNSQEEMFWTIEAAKNGDIENQIALLRRYEETDPEKAKYWGEKAAKAGNKAADVMLWSSFPDEYKAPPLLDIGCVVFNIGLLEKSWTSCD